MYKNYTWVLSVTWFSTWVYVWKHIIINRRNCGKEGWVRIESDSYLTLENLEILVHNQVLFHLII